MLFKYGLEDEENERRGRGRSPRPGGSFSEDSNWLRSRHLLGKENVFVPFSFICLTKVFSLNRKKIALFDFQNSNCFSRVINKH